MKEMDLIPLLIRTGSCQMVVNVVNKHVLFYFILFGILAQWEGEMNNYDGWPSKGIPLKTMRVVVKGTTKGDARRKREG
jgi:hypothetical protein